MEIAESNLNDIMSPFLQKITSRYRNFTPKEIQVASLIKEGKTHQGNRSDPGHFKKRHRSSPEQHPQQAGTDQQKNKSPLLSDVSFLIFFFPGWRRQDALCGTPPPTRPCTIVIIQPESILLFGLNIRPPFPAKSGSSFSACRIIFLISYVLF